MKQFQLAEDVRVSTVAIKVRNIEKMMRFYRESLGFVLKIEENGLAIFGSKELVNRLLILEEVASLEKEISPFKKAFCFSFLVPTEEHFMAIRQRLNSEGYATSPLMKEKRRTGFFVTDPEGNQIEISCYVEYKQNKDFRKYQADDVVNQSVEDQDSVRIDRLSIPITDMESQYKFYTHTLGIPVNPTGKKQLQLNNQNVLVDLIDYGKGFPSKLIEEGELGVEFFVLVLKREQDMVDLKNHLEKNQHEFFVDKRLTVLTIFDPNNIEWWFVRN